jgi:hypothetical protein
VAEDQPSLMTGPRKASLHLRLDVRGPEQSETLCFVERSATSGDQWTQWTQWTWWQLVDGTAGEFAKEDSMEENTTLRR